jgi:SAM-dependent methyltransferase
VLGSLRRRLRQTTAALFRPQFVHLELRIDNVEAALHRDVNGLIASIEERAFVISELVVATRVSEMQALVQAAAREQAEGARAHAEAASASALTAAIAVAQEHTEAAVAAAMAQSIAVAQEHTEAAVAAAMAQSIDAASQHAEAAVEYTSHVSEERLAQVKTELARTRRIVERLEKGGVEQPPPAADGIARAVQRPTPEVDDLLYLAIEDRFRGEPAEIKARQERYLPFLPDVIDEAHPVLDLGAGRGEWLAVLAEHDVPARGVDSNASCVDECREAGLRVDVGDLVDFLAASEDQSFGAISMFHVVEHLPFGVLADVIRECGRVLVPGGLLIAETPNALNLRVAATNFWLDPTHVRPLHPELLRLLADRGGFARTQDLFVNEIGTPLEFEPDGPADEWLQQFSRSLDGPGDYALLAWTPSGESVQRS